jgi:hypothetical protein
MWMIIVMELLLLRLLPSPSSSAPHHRIDTPSSIVVHDGMLMMIDVVHCSSEDGGMVWAWRGEPDIIIWLPAASLFPTPGRMAAPARTRK